MSVQIYDGPPPVGREAASGPDIPTAAVEAIGYPTSAASMRPAVEQTSQPKTEVLSDGGDKGRFPDWFSGEAKGLGQCSTHNMLSAREHPVVVDDYLAAEYGKGRVLGPLKQELFPHVHPNKFGVN